MRTLSATLLAAQKKPDRLPYVEAKVYDYEQGIKRLTWTRLYEGSEPDNHHGIAFDSQGSMHRIRAAATNTLYRQKITSPGPSSDYSQWTQIATDCHGPCAIAASGAKVYIFYRDTSNNLVKYYSHNYGQDWTKETLLGGGGGGLPGYSYRKQITINGSSAGAQTNYQLKLTVHKGSGTDSPGHVYLNNHCQDDFDDVRFTKLDGVTELDHWREEYTSGDKAVFWIEFDSIPASPGTANFYIYYDNAGAGPGSNGDNAFLFFDDFPGTSLDTAKWDGDVASFSVADGALKSNVLNKRIYSKTATALAGHAVEARMKLDASARGAIQGRSDAATGGAEDAYALRGRAGNADVDLLKIIDGVVTILDTEAYTHDTNWKRLSLRLVGSALAATYDTKELSATDATYASGRPAVRCHNAYYVYWDWLFARNLCSPEPAWGTWGSEEQMGGGGGYPDVLSLAASWWGTGNIVICFALTASEINGITLDTSTQTATQHTNDFSPPHTLTDTYGIGATYDASGNLCQVVFAAREDDDPYDHYDLWRTQFSAAYNFLAIESFLMAPAGEDITYEYPDCHLPASPQSYETTRITAVEKFAGTTAYTRPLTCHLVKGEYFSDATFTEPKPFLDLTSSYGLRIATNADYWWLSRPDGVWRAPRAAGEPLDLTKDILSLTQRSSSPSTGEDRGEGALTIQLDNHKGQYATPGTGALASLRFRSEIVLKLGYKTSQGNESSEAGTYWIDGWEYSSSLSPGGSSATLQGRASGTSTFVLFCLDGHGLADRWTARYQMRWNKDEVGPKTVWQILHRILSRFGIRLTNTPPKPQSSAINNFYPDFTINPGTGGDAAIRRLLSFVPDKLVFRGQEAFTKNPLSNESSCYSYKFPSPSKGEGQGEGEIHTILAGEYREQVAVSRARAIGRTDAGARIVEDAQDWQLINLAIDILKQDYDPNLEDATRTQERADALLRTESLRAQRGNLVVPTNVGQELLDVVTVTDERCGISSQKYRVEAIQTDCDCRQGTYQQQLTLGAP